MYDLRLTLNRVSGDISNWKRVNRRFLNTLRKQFLIWRTLDASERERYAGGGTVVAAGGDGAGVPASPGVAGPAPAPAV